VVRWAKWLHQRDASPHQPSGRHHFRLAPTGPSSHATARGAPTAAAGGRTHAGDYGDVGAAAGLIVAGVDRGVHQGGAGGVPPAAGVGGAGGCGVRGRGGGRGRALVRGARGGAGAGADLRRRCRARGRRRRRVEVRRGRARRAARVPGAPPRDPLHQVRSRRFAGGGLCLRWCGPWRVVGSGMANARAIGAELSGIANGSLPPRMHASIFFPLPFRVYTGLQGSWCAWPQKVEGKMC
jgi:hypothetical protein